jgi:hypothetical protein
MDSRQHRRAKASVRATASKPSKTNITICASHVAASRNSHDGIVRARRTVADDRCRRDRPRGTLTRADYLGHSENHQRRRRHEGRVQALWQRDAIQRPTRQASRTTAPISVRPSTSLAARTDGCDMTPTSSARPTDQLDQHQRQKDRERIVGAGFHLQRRAHARTQTQALTMNQKEYGGRVRGRHHRADQQRLRPMPTPSVYLATGAVISAVSSTPTVARTADGASTALDALETGLQPAVEQDQRQRHRADQVGGLARRRTGRTPPGPTVARNAMPTKRKTSSSGAPNRSASRLDRMPAITRTEPSRMAILTESRDAISYVCLRPPSKCPHLDEYRRSRPTPTHLSRDHERAGFAGVKSPAHGIITHPDRRMWESGERPNRIPARTRDQTSDGRTGPSFRKVSCHGLG